LYVRALGRHWTELRPRQGRVGTGSRSAVHCVLGKRTSLPSVLAMQHCQMSQSVWNGRLGLAEEATLCTGVVRNASPFAICSARGEAYESSGFLRTSCVLARAAFFSRGGARNGPCLVYVVTKLSTMAALGPRSQVGAHRSRRGPCGKQETRLQTQPDSCSSCS
jgi:hypothetical protein